MMAKKSSKKSGAKAKTVSSVPESLIPDDPFGGPIGVPKPSSKIPIEDLDCCQIVALVAYFRVKHCCCKDKDLPSVRWMCDRLRLELKGITISADAFDDFEEVMAARLGSKSCMRLHPQLAGMISQYSSGCCKHTFAEPGFVTYAAEPDTEPPDPGDDVWPTDDGKWG